jgi:hypothetical protein
MPGSDSRTAEIVAKPGGVMTDEVGAVTGDLTLRTELDAEGRVRVLVQYTGADEWYQVTDAPTVLPPGTTLDDLHASLVRQLGRP